MKSPMIAAGGHTYEKAAIEAWLQGNSTSPVTGCTLAHSRRYSWSRYPYILVRIILYMSDRNIDQCFVIAVVC